MTRIRTLALGAIFAASTLSAHAGLVNRGGGLIYDDVLNVTWLADLNYAKTSGFDADGLMNWSTANQWADTLVYGGFSDWRLPTLNPKDTTCSSNFDAGGGLGLQYYGTGCTGGELSHLFVSDFDNMANSSALALFSNLPPVPFLPYWSGTEYAPGPGDAWVLTNGGTFQGLVGKDLEVHAVAVRPGDVPAVVPEPQSLALVLLALGAAVVARRKRPA